MKNLLSAKWPDGARVKKTKKEFGDTQEVGALGTILEYFGMGHDFRSGRKVHAYVIRWDDDDRDIVCFNTPGRLELVQEAALA